MTISPEMSLTSVASLEDVALTPFQIGYLKALAQDQAHETVLRVFLDASDHDPCITKAFLARRAGKDPAQITNFLSAPGNWTLGTYALLLAALGHKATLGSEPIRDMRWENMAGTGRGTGLTTLHNHGVSWGRAIP